MDNSSLFTIDTETWGATAVPSSEMWRSSDLANSNLLAKRIVKELPDLFRNTEASSTDKIQLYPNPVTGNRFTIQFNLENPGSYVIQIADAVGKQTTAQNIVSVTGKNQSESVQLPASAKKGVYLVKVTDQAHKTVFSKKIIVR
jgi:hypothetical protein